MIPHPIRNVIVWDIDGTLSDPSHRDAYGPWWDKGKHNHEDHDGPEWDEYYYRIGDDPPIRPMVRVAWSFHDFGFTQVVATGRPERCRRLTEDWLMNVEFPPHEMLVMRPAGNKMRTAELKALHAETIGPERVALWVDDHPGVESSLRGFSIPVLTLYNVDFDPTVEKEWSHQK